MKESKKSIIFLNKNCKIYFASSQKFTVMMQFFVSFDKGFYMAGLFSYDLLEKLEVSCVFINCQFQQLTCSYIRNRKCPNLPATFVPLKASFCIFGCLKDHFLITIHFNQATLTKRHEITWSNNCPLLNKQLEVKQSYWMISPIMCRRRNFVCEGSGSFFWCIGKRAQGWKSRRTQVEEVSCY